MSLVHRNVPNDYTRNDVYINADLTPAEAMAAYEQRCQRRQRLLASGQQQDYQSFMDQEAHPSNHPIDRQQPPSGHQEYSSQYPSRVFRPSLKAHIPSEPINVIQASSALINSSINTSTNTFTNPTVSTVGVYARRDANSLVLLHHQWLLTFVGVMPTSLFCTPSETVGVCWRDANILVLPRHQWMLEFVGVMPTSLFATPSVTVSVSWRDANILVLPRHQWLLAFVGVMPTSLCCHAIRDC